MKDKRKPIIELRNVWKTYKMGTVEINALQGMDFSVRKEEFVAIMGPSGSGKSTAVHMIGCLDLPTKGKVYLEGCDISRMSESRLAQMRGKRIGFVFQQFNLIQTLNAIENVTLPMVFQGIPSKERIERGTKLLEMVDLGNRIYHKPTEMSGGEQQRVALARALANNPDILLADEPTGNLDTKTGELIIKLICKLHKEEKKTIVIVTHDENIARCAQRIAHIRDGKIIRGGS